MKKILGFIIIVCVLVTLLVFQAPETTSKIEKAIGLEGLTSGMLDFKKSIDNIGVTVPAKEELVDTYNNLYSGAVDGTQKVVDGLNTTKEKVDNVRETLSGAQDKIDTTIQTVKETQAKINEVKQNIEELQKVGNDLINVMGTGTTQ